MSSYRRPRRDYDGYFVARRNLTSLDVHNALDVERRARILDSERCDCARMSLPSCVGFVMYRKNEIGFESINASEKERIVVRLDGRGARLYYPGETLAGSYYLNEIRQPIETTEISVLWQTEGKGNEDVGVHAFWRLSVHDGDWIDPVQPGRFSVVLPQCPLSYDGAIVKIRWFVRVRVFLANDAQLVGEAPFRLGALPDPRTL